MSEFFWREMINLKKIMRSFKRKFVNLEDIHLFSLEFLGISFLSIKVSFRAVLLYDFNIIFIEINALSRSNPKHDWPFKNDVLAHIGKTPMRRIL
jgi:hypothetical protein